MSSVTTIDPQPYVSDCELAHSANCDKKSNCCESVEHEAKNSHVKNETEDSSNSTVSPSRRRKWISLAAISAAITFMVAPLCVGALQRPATTNTAHAAKPTANMATSTHPRIDAGVAPEPQNSPDATDNPNMAQDDKRCDESSQPTIGLSPRLPPPPIDTPPTKCIGTDYVAMREPTEDGDRVRIVVFEPNRDIYIHESVQDGIQVRVRRYLFGTSTEQMVSAPDIEDLKEQSTEAFELYSNHIGKANLLGPAVSIYPAEEVAWLQPSGFLTAMSIDEPKSSSKKNSDKKKTSSGKKENDKSTATKKESMKKDSQQKEASKKAAPKKEATKKATSTKAAAKKDATKPKPVKNSQKDTANNSTGKKISSKKQDANQETKKQSTSNQKESKESTSKKSANQRAAAMKSKSEKQAAKKAPTDPVKSRVAKSSQDVPSKKSTAKKEAKPNSKPKSEPNKKSVLQRPLNDPAEMSQLATKSSHADVGKDV